VEVTLCFTFTVQHRQVTRTRDSKTIPSSFSHRIAHTGCLPIMEPYSPTSQGLMESSPQGSNDPQSTGFLVLTSERSTTPPSRDSTVSAFQESTTRYSDDIDKHVNQENTRLRQVSVDNTLLQIKDLVHSMQVHQQELGNNTTEVKKRDETITTLSAEIKSKNATIEDLQAQIKEKDDALEDMRKTLKEVKKSNSTKNDTIKGLKAVVREKDHSLLMKNDTITDTSRDNSRKKHRITMLEFEVRSKDKTIASLEKDLCDNIIRREKLEQEFERLGMQTESRQRQSLRGKATGFMHHFRGPSRSSRLTPISKKSDCSPSAISPDPSQAVTSHPTIAPQSPSSTPKIPSQSPGSPSQDQPQSSNPPTTTFQKPAKAASVDWSTMTTAQGRSPHPRFGREVDSQLRQDIIRGWSRDIRVPEFKGFHTSYEDLVNAAHVARGGKEIKHSE
jgi:hypothetical protein